MSDKPYKPRTFTPEKQGIYVSLRLAGKGHYAAAAHVGVNPKTVNRFIEATPEFREKVEAAEQELVDLAEEKLFEAVEAGEPWAISKVLSTQRRAKWAEKQQVEVSGTVRHELEALPTDELLAHLQEKIDQRREVVELSRPEVLDVEE